MQKSRLKGDFFTEEATKKPSKFRQKLTKKSRLLLQKIRLLLPSLCINNGHPPSQYYVSELGRTVL
jgi:hypothetical protein